MLAAWAHSLTFDKETLEPISTVHNPCGACSLGTYDRDNPVAKDTYNDDIGQGYDAEMVSSNRVDLINRSLLQELEFHINIISS